MPGRGSDDRRRHDRAGDDTFAVDQPQRVALTLQIRGGWLLVVVMVAKSTSGSDPASRHSALFALRGCFPVKPVGQRPLSDFGEALLQLGTGSNEGLDDGDVITIGQRMVLRAQHRPRHWRVVIGTGARDRHGTALDQPLDDPRITYPGGMNTFPAGRRRRARRNWVRVRRQYVRVGRSARRG